MLQTDKTIDLFGKLHSKCCEQDRAVSPLVMTIFPPRGVDAADSPSIRLEEDVQVLKTEIFGGIIRAL